MSDEMKTCSRCMKDKIKYMDFYMCQDKYRSECKRCTIKKNIQYQKKIQSWKNRCIDNIELKKYMTEYYANNKEKFAEYRKRFKEKNPDYYKNYSRRRKNEKPEK